MFGKTKIALFHAPALGAASGAMAAAKHHARSRRPAGARHASAAAYQRFGFGAAPA